MKAFFNGKAVTLKTDQKSVSFIFDQKHKRKIKNDKIICWRAKLSCYSFDIMYKPRKENIAQREKERFCFSPSTHLKNNFGQMQKITSYPPCKDQKAWKNLKDY